MTEKTLIHINLASGYGGGEVQTLNLIERLPSYNQLVLCKKGSAFSEKCIERFSNSPNISVVSLWKIMRFCMQNKQTILHAHDGRGAHLARFIANIFGLKFVISRRVDKPLKRRSSLATYQRANAIIAVSQKVADSLEGVNSEIKVIHDSYSTLPQNYGIEERLEPLHNKFVVTQLGSLLDIKNVPFTIQLAKNLRQTHPNIHFLIVGEGKEQENLHQQALALPNITFFGFTPYVASVLKKTDLLIMPSKSEGLGSAVLEAYQHDVPVLTSRVGGLPEIVFEGKTGYMFDLKSISDAQSKLIQLVEDKKQYQRMKDEIRTIKKQYSPESMTQSYLECYQNLS